MTAIAIVLLIVGVWVIRFSFLNAIEEVKEIKWRRKMRRRRSHENDRPFERKHEWHHYEES